MPVCSRAEGGSEEHAGGSIGCANSPALEPWRPVFLLLPLADGASCGRAAAVCQENWTRPKVPEANQIVPLLHRDECFHSFK